MSPNNETSAPLQVGKVVRARRGRWPLDVRLRVARVVVDEQVAAREAAARFGVPYTTVAQWAAWYRRGGDRQPSLPVEVRVRARGTGNAAMRAAILATKEAEPQAGSPEPKAA